MLQSHGVLCRALRLGLLQEGYHFCLHQAVFLSRTLHFHRSFPLVYRDRLAISYRDHAHNQELTAALATIKDFADNAETNWNSSEGLRRYPITISFARKVGMLMTELSE